MRGFSDRSDDKPKIIDAFHFGFPQRDFLQKPLNRGFLPNAGIIQQNRSHTTEEIAGVVPYLLRKNTVGTLRHLPRAKAPHLSSQIPARPKFRG